MIDPSWRRNRGRHDRRALSRRGSS